MEADRDRIIQVLSNLLSNSIKFRNQGEISINLFEKIKDKADGKTEVLVSLTDKDSGINSEIFERLFSKFASKSYQGTGQDCLLTKVSWRPMDEEYPQNNSINGDKSTGATITFTLPTATTLNRDN